MTQVNPTYLPSNQYVQPHHYSQPPQYSPLPQNVPPQYTQRQDSTSNATYIASHNEGKSEKKQDEKDIITGFLLFILGFVCFPFFLVCYCKYRKSKLRVLALIALIFFFIDLLVGVIAVISFVAEIVGVIYMIGDIVGDLAIIEQIIKLFK